MAPKKPCIECHQRPKYGTRQRCSWCWIAREPAALQEAWASHRLQKAQEKPGYVYRARVSEKDWEAGRRWCAGCQWMIPTEYASGSRCKACASRQRHRGYVERTYGITGDEYDALAALQGGRCYICRQMPQTIRLAVDHDHLTGLVRGLLCAGQEQGCNWNYRKALGDIEVASRILAYATDPPMAQLRRAHGPDTDRIEQRP
jgi:hypothetical protein